MRAVVPRKDNAYYFRAIQAGFIKNSLELDKRNAEFRKHRTDTDVIRAVGVISGSNCNYAISSNNRLNAMSSLSAVS